MENISLTDKQVLLVLERWLGRLPGRVRMRRLHGGMCSTVIGLEFEAEPHRAVLKADTEPGDRFGYERRGLEHLREVSQLPAPEPYWSAQAGEVIEPAVLLLEWIPGVNLGEAALDDQSRRQVDVQLADTLIELHSHSRPFFGDVEQTEVCERWSGVFRPMIEEMYSDALPRLPERTARIIAELLEDLPKHFLDETQPVLVHGDIWATNVMVAQCLGAWRITGLLDPAARYADVEYELAYLEGFSTAGPAFFEQYQRHRPMRQGYATRRLYYWLNTMLLHVWLFGDNHYISRTELIADTLLRRLEGQPQG